MATEPAISCLFLRPVPEGYAGEPDGIDGVGLELSVLDESVMDGGAVVGGGVVVEGGGVVDGGVVVDGAEVGAVDGQ